MLKEKEYRNNILVIRSLVFINRFAYLSRIKLSRKDSTTLLDYFFGVINSLGKQEYNITGNQKESCRILSFIYKQVECKGDLKTLKVHKLPAYAEYFDFTYQDKWLMEKYNEIS